MTRAGARGLVLSLSLALSGATAFAQVDAGAAADGSADAAPEGGAEGEELPEDATPPSTEEEAAASAVLGPSDDEASVADATLGEGAVEGPALPASPTLATQIAALTERSCLRALARARVPYRRVRSTLGIGTAVRISGPIRSVVYHHSGDRGVNEVMDCHLAVALVRFSTLLRSLHVREVRHLSLLRQASPSAVLRRPLQPGHAGAMAIDAGIFVFDDGSRLDVYRDFHGRRGRPPCGPSARVQTRRPARVLRSIVCEAARQGLFHVLLTPNHNYEHRNHFHLEVLRGVSWQFVR